MLVKHMIKTAAVLSLFALSGTGLVTFTHWQTHDEMVRSEMRALLRSLHAVVDPTLYNNVLLDDTIEIPSDKLLGSKKPSTVYRARMNGEPVALILSPVAPDGYNGDIRLLVGILNDGRVSGVRVLDHRETPGLGDGIEARRSNWINSFRNKSLTDPGVKKWRVKRDSGVFDQFTGATITPRAIVKAVHKTLLYVQQNRQALFTITPKSKEIASE